MKVTILIGTKEVILSKNECQIISLTLQGIHCCKEIADRLNITDRAIKSRFQRLYKKFEIDYNKFDPKVRLVYILYQAKCLKSFQNLDLEQ